MGCLQDCIFSPRDSLVIISLIILLVSISTQVSFMAEGRAIFKLMEVDQVGREEKVIVRAQIGSRPPRCERICSSCGDCEAVQVPAVPQDKKGSRSQHSSKQVSNTAYSRGEGTSNYKPMSWKCKCGNMIFNP